MMQYHFTFVCMPLLMMPLLLLFQEELVKSQEEQNRTKVRLDVCRKQTLDMFLEIFNDFSLASASPRLSRNNTDMYKSSPNLNIDSMSSSYSSHSTMSSSVSADSAFSRESDRLGMSSSYHSKSQLDLSSPIAEAPSMENLMSRSMYSSPVTPLSGGYQQGSKLFQEKVTDLKCRLATLLESNYNQAISTASDTTQSSYMRNLKLRKARPRSGGRVFTVFSRTNHRKYPHSSSDNILPTQLGCRDQ